MALTPMLFHSQTKQRHVNVCDRETDALKHGILSHFYVSDGTVSNTNLSSTSAPQNYALHGNGFDSRHETSYIETSHLIPL